MRIKTIKYTYDGHISQFEPNAKGLLEFTVIGHKIKYYIKITNSNKHNILNFDSWEYDELEYLHIYYRPFDGDTVPNIDAMHIRGLPLKYLYIDGARITGNLPGARLCNKKGDSRYVWDNLLMYLPTLESVTIKDSNGILYALDLLYNASLEYAQFHGVEIKEIRSYEDNDELHLSFSKCRLDKSLIIKLVDHYVHCLKTGRSFKLELDSTC